VGWHPRDLAGPMQNMAEFGDGWLRIFYPAILHEGAAEQRALWPTRPPHRPGASSRRQRHSPASGRLGRRAGNACAGSSMSLKRLNDVPLAMSGGPIACPGFSPRMAAMPDRSRPRFCGLAAVLGGGAHRSPAGPTPPLGDGSKGLRRTGQGVAADRQYPHLNQTLGTV
jgi:hypothetical protein